MSATWTLCTITAPRPRSAIGVLAEALDRRRHTHGTGLTLISCDNVQSNSNVLRNVLLAFAQERAPDLAAWIVDQVRFPSTMVDRIVPASQSEDLERAAVACGLEDRAAVIDRERVPGSASRMGHRRSGVRVRCPTVRAG